MKIIKDLLLGIFCGFFTCVIEYLLFYLSYVNLSDTFFWIITITLFLIGIAATILTILIKTKSVKSVLIKAISIFVSYIAFSVFFSFSGLSSFVFNLFFGLSANGGDFASGIISFMYQFALLVCNISTFIPMLAVCSDNAKKQKSRM